MKTVTLGLKNPAIEKKVLWLLEHFKGDGVEIMEKEDLSDLHAVLATRGEPTVSLEEYISHAD